ncbi:hypothetical protein BCV70DRAFT_116709 [Testicularia cyperi]|uniref:Uncharacterized protein n=1 Tax=Testicularia cyperi TaxID=1882483 RepID=A0A317XN68_9BASI|nr:hypothetical protein BCV70DRAFT_116709 [Testicularia cyperi]
MITFGLLLVAREGGQSTSGLRLGVTEARALRPKVDGTVPPFGHRRAVVRPVDSRPQGHLPSTSTRLDPQSTAELVISRDCSWSSEPRPGLHQNLVVPCRAEYMRYAGRTQRRAQSRGTLFSEVCLSQYALVLCRSETVIQTACLRRWASRRRSQGAYQKSQRGLGCVGAAPDSADRASVPVVLAGRSAGTVAEAQTLELGRAGPQLRLPMCHAWTGIG